MPSVLHGAVQRLWDASEADYRQQILELMPHGDSVLDVGCDDGSWTAKIAEASGATQVAGIEITDARRAAQARGVDARDGDLEEVWPFDDGVFDVVHANQVIEHVRRLDHFVTEVARVLRPGGRAVVCTENLSSWHNIGAALLGYMPFSLTNVSEKGSVGNPYAMHPAPDPARGQSWQHVHVLTMDGLRDIFTMHGFRLERRFGSGYYPAFGRAGQWLARRDPRHAHFIGVVVHAP